VQQFIVCELVAVAVAVQYHNDVDGTICPSAGPPARASV